MKKDQFGGQGNISKSFILRVKLVQRSLQPAYEHKIKMNSIQHSRFYKKYVKTQTKSYTADESPQRPSFIKSIRQKNNPSKPAPPSPTPPQPRIKKQEQSVAARFHKRKQQQQQQSATTHGSPNPVPAQKQNRQWKLHKTDSFMQGSFNSTKTQSKVCCLAAGLVNAGNSCYLNAVVQSLYSIPVLCNSLPQLVSKSSNRYKAIQSLHNLFNRLSDNGGPHSTYSIRKAVAQIQPRFSLQLQEDAHEFLMTFIQALHRELNSAKGCTYKELRNDPHQTNLSLIVDEWWKSAKKIDDSKVHDLFAGQMLTMTQCVLCERRVVALDMFIGLNLPLPSEKVLLQECITQYFKEQLLQKEYFCRGCKTYRKANLTQNICRPPMIMLLQLKRFDKATKKKTSRIKIPQKLDLTSYLAPGTGISQQYKPLIYTLRAVVLHKGGLDCGHYTTNCLRKDSWLDFNDQQCKKIEGKPRFLQGGCDLPYIIFYQIQQ